MNLPSISIIIPTFNRGKLIQQTLNSLRYQTFKNWEALVVDDGSNDGTDEKVLCLSKEDSRIKYVKRRSQKTGAPVCRNEGTKLSQGKYIIYLDSDDCLAPESLENRFKLMEQYPDLDFGIFPCMLFENEPGDMNLLWNIDKDENDIDRFLNFDIPWQTTSPIWRREALTKVGYWNEELLSWQDFELHLRALIKNLKYQRFSKPDCFWRIPHQNSIGSKSVDKTHLKSYEKLFFDIQQMLIDAQILTPKRKYLIGGLYFWLMNTWLSQAQKAEALEVWFLSYQRNIIDKKQYFYGRWYIEVGSVWVPYQFVRKIFLRVIREYFQIILPQGLIPKLSNTFRTISLS
ncbi:Glycosyltransferase family 2 protein [Nostoc sp. DSM 114161]|jgi:glycosyltransferase involved in cell wall biosynthesis|uniref:glycosyltransferase family 2 protein n=1 Tax=Nostoc sp. DSM 114161 TaxID=3440143 RepID=UPI00404603F1